MKKVIASNILADDIDTVISIINSNLTDVAENIDEVDYESQQQVMDILLNMHTESKNLVAIFK